jgi:DNA repair exonuclease SbcCD nuclease subunit
MAKYFRAVVSSDWHLDGLARHFGDHIERQFYELDKVYRYAVDNGINHVVVPGDISDTPNMSDDVYIALIKFLKKYDGLVHTYYLAGNHDFANIKKTSMDLLNVLYGNDFFKTFHLFLNPEARVIDGLPINFLPYPCKESPASDTPHLNFSHIEYNGALGDNGRKLRVKDEFIQNEGDYNISGHIHMYQHMESKRAIYCGNPYQKNFGESLPKGWLDIKARLNKKGTKVDLKHQFVHNKPDFRFENVVIESQSDFAKLSTSDSVRYKLWVDPSLEVPKNIRLEYPNITGGIFDLQSKKKASEDNHDVASVGPSEGTRINLRSGLTKRLKAEGFDKRQIEKAKNIVTNAANELGITL